MYQIDVRMRLKSVYIEILSRHYLDEMQLTKTLMM